MCDDAIFVVTGPPKTFEFGLDCMYYDTGPEFRGVSLIPPGFHFVYHSTGMGARQGFFINTQKKDIVITSWDPGNEEIVLTPLISEMAIENLKNGIIRGDLNKNLGPYPLAQHSRWLNLSSRITADVLARADISCGTLVYPGDVDDDAHLTASHLKSVKPYFPGLARIARFAPLLEMEKQFTKGASENPTMTATELSRCHMDKTAFVMNLVNEYFNQSFEDLLGELELSFVLFMMIYSYTALEHWKQLLNTLCQCEELMHTNPLFYSAFLRIVYEQLNYSPDDFFHTELSHKNFLRPAMSSLFQLLNTEGIPDVLEEHRRRLLNFMRKKFNLFEENVGSEYFNYDDAKLYNVKQAELFPSSDDMYNLVDENRPLIVCLDEDKPTASVPTPPSINQEALEPKDIEREKFGWRYPFLFDAMEPNEDMTMTAVRLIESNRTEEEMEVTSETNSVATTKESIVVTLPMATQEARLFIENELPLFTDMRT